MYRILFLFFLMANALFADIYSGNIDDDVNATNIPKLYDENMAAPTKDYFRNFDVSKKVSSGTTNNIGITTYKDVNLSNTQNIKNLLDSIKRKASATANGIIGNISKNTKEAAKYKTKNLKELTIDKLKATTSDQKKLTAYQETEDTVTKLLNTFGSANVIHCYIKRKLIPSFYCPMSGKNNSYFTGGLANTSNEKAQNECNKYCQTKQSCLSMKIDGFTNASPSVTINKFAPVDKSIVLSSKQQVKSTEFILQSTDDNISVNVNILEKTNNEKDLYKPNFWEQNNRCFSTNNIKSKNYCTGSNLAGVAEIDQSGCPSGTGKIKCWYRGKTYIVKNYEVTLNRGKNSIDIPVALKNNPSYEIEVLMPYTYTFTKRKSVAKPNTVKLLSVITHYDDNKFWFCPAKHFVNNVSECYNGKIHNLIIGGSPTLVCSKKSDLIREPLYGAYYSQDACNADCFEKMDCQPTYKNLNGGVTSSVYNVDYGCMSGNNNKSCTKDACKQKIFNNIMPNLEKVYYNDTKSEVTVLNGQTVSGKVRPIYNISAEMSSNNNAVEKKKLMISTQKDMAYRNMMANNTYVISAKVLSQTYPLQTKATIINYSGVSIEYVPRSDLFNTNKNAYVYVVTANKYHYNEEDPFTSSSISRGSTDYKSINYTIMDSSRKLNLFYIADKIETTDSNNNYVAYSSPQYLEKTLDPSTGYLASYDTNDYAPVFKTVKFFSDQYRFDVNIANNYFNYANSQDGTYLRKVSLSNGHVHKKYSGTKDSETGGTIDDFYVYMITSDKKLTYKKIIDEIKNKTIHQAYSYSFSNNYTKDIPGDASAKFNNDNIKIFVLGKSNSMSLVGEYTPGLNEEGKDAFVFNFLYNEK